MLYIALPSGDYGAGVRGDNLSKALASLTTTVRFRGGDTLPSSVSGTLFQLSNGTFRPWSKIAASYHVGYTVFDLDLVATRTLASLTGGFDLFVTASQWCEEVLRDAGVKNVITVHSGVDTTTFRPECALRRRFQDRFVIFSGGRFCLQKAQDVVLKATKVLIERHPDVLLLVAWTSPARWEFKSMKASPYYPPIFDGRYKDGDDMMRQWIVETEFDVDRIVFVPQMTHAEMASVYGDSDVGLFPNRCEGDTNLMLMEYMACGRPAVATDFSGHRDIVSNDICLPLRAWTISPYIRYDTPVACWCEPQIEEVVEALEHAYRNRDRMDALGRAATAAMQEWTWQRAATDLLKTLT